MFRLDDESSIGRMKPLFSDSILVFNRYYTLDESKSVTIELYENLLIKVTRTKLTSTLKRLHVFQLFQLVTMLKVARRKRPLKLMSHFLQTFLLSMPVSL